MRILTSEPTHIERVHIEVGQVTGKGRARSGNGHHYTPQKTRAAETEVATLFKAQRQRDMAEFAGGVAIDVIAHRQLPKSATKKRIGELDLAKPDGDNILKLICDALNGVAFKDDCQCFDKRIHKVRRGAYGSGDWYDITVEYFEE